MKVSYDKTITVTIDLDVKKVAEAIVEDYKKEATEDEYEYIYDEIGSNMIYYLAKLGFITEEEEKDMWNCDFDFEEDLIRKVQNYIEKKYKF